MRYPIAMEAGTGCLAPGAAAEGGEITRCNVRRR